MDSIFGVGLWTKSKTNKFKLTEIFIQVLTIFSLARTLSRETLIEGVLFEGDCWV